MRRHDRHGRLTQADDDPRARPSPGFRTGSAARFQSLLRRAVAALPATMRQRVARARIVVVDVPSADLLAAEVGQRRCVVMHTEADGVEVLTVFRRRVEQWSTSRADLLALLTAEIRQAAGDG